MNVVNYITADRDVCHGKPCFKGTRIMASNVLELLEAGESTQEILEDCPSLTVEHIRAALHLASEFFGKGQFFKIPAA